MDPVAIIAAAGGVLGGLTGVTSVFVVRHQRKKLTAETEKAEVDTADVVQQMTLRLIQPLNQRVDELEATVRTQSEELGLMRRTLQTVYLEIMSPSANVPALREFALREIAVRYTDWPEGRHREPREP